MLLEQTPVIEGALVAIDNHTGQVLAMVGGYSFARSKFNRATQAYRQMGSTVKPILYTAAIDRGLTPTTILVDEPTTFDAGVGQPPYAPGNYDRKFLGTMTLRYALEQSRNIPAVKVIEMLGPTQVASYAKKFGFTQDFRPFLSMALGAQEVTLLELTSAFSAFPNHGIRMEPYLAQAINDRDGSLLEERRPQPKDAIRADTAFVMTNLLQGVVQRGTGAAANSLNWTLAGKTGTVDDYTDAWFVGFDPDITVGVWLGHDEKKPLGPGETGTTAALPMWIDFMKDYLDLYHPDRKEGERPQFRAARQHHLHAGRSPHRRTDLCRRRRLGQRSLHLRHTTWPAVASDCGFRIEWIADQLRIARSSITVVHRSYILAVVIDDLIRRSTDLLKRASDMRSYL